MNKSQNQAAPHTPLITRISLACSLSRPKSSPISLLSARLSLSRVTPLALSLTSTALITAPPPRSRTPMNHAGTHNTDTPLYQPLTSTPKPHTNTHKTIFLDTTSAPHDHRGVERCNHLSNALLAERHRDPRRRPLPHHRLDLSPARLQEVNRVNLLRVERLKDAV